jgi:hypothetical protein
VGSGIASFVGIALSDGDGGDLAARQGLRHAGTRTAKLQVPFAVPSASQAGSPSVQPSRPVAMPSKVT